jgi:hypothetical protein
MTISHFVPGARLALSFLLALTFAQGAFGETRVTPLGDGQFSVDMRGCSVRLDKHGEVLSQGRDCSRGQLVDAQDAVKTYRREQNGSDNHSGGGYKDENAHKIIGDGKATLRDRPSKDGSRVTSMKKGDYVDVIKCEKHHGNQWCRVRYNHQEGWVGKRRLKKVD